ncbi:MAG: bifunctional [glutamate--ammonia ligase]-adenylyl-L-tyrosine phosphorylase/[glutamate--ammonia-ligase] adenylyltransferase [Cellvibrionaceae bacterium]
MFQSVQIPEHLIAHLDRFQRQWQSAASDGQQQSLSRIVVAAPALLEQFATAIIGSEFIAKQCLEHPDAFLSLLQDQRLQSGLSNAAIRQFLSEGLDRSDEAEFDKSLRQVRREFMLSIVWRDLNRLADLEQTTAELSAFAEACLQYTMDYHYAALVAQRGLPIGEYSAAPQPMLVLGMGKLGAGELNVSSDIDLIFTYPESGDTQGHSRSLSNQEFFLRLGQKVIKSLDTITADGFVFRVDMRLRPYGASGALVSNFDSLENYYQTQGREWERYAMIKARVVAATSDEVIAACVEQAKLADAKTRPAADYATGLMQLLQPFTYRRYLDYSAIDAMRAMKQLITREVSRKGLQSDVKLGAGGIREVEFIVQVFQLIRGGRDPRLQERRLLKVLPLLAETGCLPAQVQSELAQAYRFLRNTEHAIQGFQDRQTQQLPIDQDTQQRLAWAMGFASWDDFAEQLQTRRRTVNEQFRAVIADPEKQQSQADSDNGEWELIWQGSLVGEAAQRFLAEQALNEPAAILEHLQQLRESRSIAGMQAAARERLDQLMPALLANLGEIDNAPVTLQRVCGVLEAVARRSAYIVLLVENPSALEQLVKLCSASPWVARQLAEHPVLLDELLDARTLYSPPDLDTLRDELHRETLRLNWEDLEGHMESLRHFRMSHALRVAACEVTGVLPLMKASDYLTYLAEVILRHVLVLAWQQMVERYGRPRRADGSPCSVAVADGDFIIVGYGKLGGIELGHGSDLDLVFVHRADPNLGTEGPREIDNATFFIRLGQKIIHILNTQTVSGQLYDIDMRLRPSGNSGLLVSSLSALARYQQQDAWDWEHQALVRARVVAGSLSLAAEFEEMRAEVICRQRNIAELRHSVIEMREKMRKHLGSRDDADEFNIKQDGGGIVDIEFMVQYAVLAWAYEHPALIRYTDNIRILGCLADTGLIAEDDADQLIEAYKTYRSTVHRLALQGLPSTVAGDQFLSERSIVVKHWQHFLIAS